MDDINQNDSSNKCMKCKNTIPHVTGCEDISSQLEDALEIQFNGYYGGYFDDLTAFIGYEIQTFGHLCKQCADEFVELNPWVKEVLEKAR